MPASFFRLSLPPSAAGVACRWLQSSMAPVAEDQEAMQPWKTVLNIDPAAKGAAALTAAAHSFGNAKWDALDVALYFPPEALAAGAAELQVRRTAGAVAGWWMNWYETARFWVCYGVALHPRPNAISWGIVHCRAAGACETGAAAARGATAAHGYGGGAAAGDSSRAHC